MPVVSVVLIFLNEERFIQEAVQSVYDQSLEDWELILVDDGSTDRSTSIARNLVANDARISYFDHPGHVNRGMAASRNLGVAQATAPYIAFLDADDVWVPGKLAEQVALLESMPDVAMVNGGLIRWYSWDPASTKADDTVLRDGVADRRIDPPEAALALYPLGPCYGAGVDLLVRRSVLNTVGGFEERFPGLLEDQTFVTKILFRYPIYISSRVWLHYRQHDASCTAKTTRMDYWRVLGALLDLLKEDADRLGDARISTAIQRARRQLPYQKLLSSAYRVYDRLSERVPTEVKKRVKHRLFALRARVRRQSMRGPTGHL